MQAYRIAFDKFDVPAYLLDQEGQLLACNGQLLRFFGFEAQGVNSIYEMLHQQGLFTRQQIKNFYQEDTHTLVSGKKNTTVETVINQTGDILSFEIVRSPLFDDAGNGFGLMVSIRNITKQKVMESKFKELEARLKYVTQYIGDTEKTISDSVNCAPLTRVLVIEDNLLTQKTEKKLLMAAHCLTDAVATVEEMKEIFKIGKYDLVLVDLGLGSGNGNGYQATRIIRDMEKETPFNVPIIALTGADINAVEFECDDSEMNGILSKPLTAEQAEQLVQRYVFHNNVIVTGLRVFKK